MRLDLRKSGAPLKSAKEYDYDIFRIFIGFGFGIRCH